MSTDITLFAVLVRNKNRCPLGSFIFYKYFVDDFICLYYIAGRNIKVRYDAK